MKKSLILFFTIYLFNISFSQNKYSNLKIDSRLSEVFKNREVIFSKSSPALIQNLNRFVETKNGENYFDVFVYTNQKSNIKFTDGLIRSIGEKYFTANLTLDEIEKITKDENILFVTLPRISKPLLEKSLPAMKVDSIHLAKINNTSYKGKNVVVGVYDTGIDFTHLDFCSDVDPTKTRILSIWDQFGTGTPPAGFNYGVEYSQTQINNEIDGTPANVVKAIDDNGHGTHVASTAAGDGSSYSITKYIGVAPEADLIIVDGGSDGFPSTNVIDGMNYIKNKSIALGKPFAINLSLGGHWGAHDGTDPQEIVIDEILATAGRSIVIAAGNEGNDAIHAEGIVAANASSTFNFTIPPYTVNPGSQDDYVSFDIWYKGNDGLKIEVITPSGQTITANPGTSANVTTTANEGFVQILNATTGKNPINNSKECQITLIDFNTSAPKSGEWKIKITGVTIAEGGSFDIWLAGKSMEAGFTLGHNFRKLVGMPGTSKKGITVGSYVTKWSWVSVNGSTFAYNGTNRTGNISTFSSQGPTRDGRVKPDITAPGQAIAAAKTSSSIFDNSVIVAGGKHVIEQGTSMAAPHITGLAALMLQMNPSLTNDKIKNSIISSAVKDAFTGNLPNETWGNGKINAVAAMRATLTSVNYDQNILPSKFTLMQNYPNPFNSETIISYQIPKAGLVTLKVFDVLGKEIATLVNENKDAGNYSVKFDASNFTTGIYFYRIAIHSDKLSSNNQTEIKKLMYLK